MEIKNNCYKGTRILFGEEAEQKRKMLNTMVDVLVDHGFKEMIIPIIQMQEMFASKVGEENQNMMYNFKDRGDRDICLAPEYTAVVQKLSTEIFKYEKNVRIFYVQECFRGEKPQAGRYRQFTQLGVEILNPSGDNPYEYLRNLAESLIKNAGPQYTEIIVNEDVTRGLDYYKNGKGFEIQIPSLGAQKQVCGGGEYSGGIGFALGIDRLLLTC